MSYEFAGGALKLKGVSEKKIKKKKKSKTSVKEVILKTVSKPDVCDSNSNHSSSSEVKLSHHQSKESEKSTKKGLEKNEEIETLVNAVIIKKPAKTKAELAFEKLQEKRAEEKVLKRAEKSHKEQVENYNRQLDNLSEYNDIPKVSWTK